MLVNKGRIILLNGGNLLMGLPCRAEEGGERAREGGVGMKGREGGVGGGVGE